MHGGNGPPSKWPAVWLSFHPELPGLATQIGVADVQHKEGLQHPPTPEQGEQLSNSFSAEVSSSTALLRTVIPPRRNLYCYMQGTASRGNGITDVALHLHLVTLESKVRMIWMYHRTRHSKRTLPIPIVLEAGPFAQAWLMVKQCLLKLRLKN